MKIILIAVIVVVFLLVVVPRTLISLKASKMKGKDAPNTHAASRERIMSGNKTVLYFSTPSCGACKKQTPIIQRIKQKYPDAVFAIDASVDRETARSYGVWGVPYTAFINEGKVISAKTGFQSDAVFEEFFQN